jgi:hypothetical protein
MTLPSRLPNSIQALLNGDSSFGLKNVISAVMTAAAPRPVTKSSSANLKWKYMATTPNTKVRNQPKRVSDGKEVLVGVIVAREYLFKTVPVLVRVVFLQDKVFYSQAYPSTIKVLLK